jgi:ATP-dependent Lon protease
LKDELAAVGIEFNYFFDADHDRNIVLDNGWKITLSRGLDIFEKFGRFSLGSVRQTNRRCRAFSVSFVQV